MIGLLAGLGIMRKSFSSVFVIGIILAGCSQDSLLNLSRSTESGESSNEINLSSDYKEQEKREGVNASKCLSFSDKSQYAFKSRGKSMIATGWQPTGSRWYWDSQTDQVYLIVIRELDPVSCYLAFRLNNIYEEPVLTSSRQKVQFKIEEDELVEYRKIISTSGTWIEREVIGVRSNFNR
jgi:hypothetical protein